MSVKRREWTPEQIDNLNGADMQAAPAVTYDSQIFRVEQFFVFNVWVDIVQVGAGAVGDATLSLRSFAEDDTLLDTWDLLTLIDTNTDAEKNLILFGAGVTATKKGNATLGSLLTSLKLGFRFQLRLTVTTTEDGTSSLAFVRMQAGD